MDEKGHFLITEVEGDPGDFIAEHRDELRALCAEPMRANSATIAGVGVEYQPPIPKFIYIVSVSQVG